MKNLKFKTRAGVEVELDDIDMHLIHRHYQVQCTADYIRENHEDWSEDKVQRIAYEARQQMWDYDYDEWYAVDKAIDWYEETYEGVEEVMESEEM